ncbi:restriction endonuclease [Malaciobacter canalis]|uniref:restriction endonuclease n=1 Tax=Malaciobacter canalis TaxID=1912871 RepID=UPI00384C6640
MFSIPPPQNWQSFEDLCKDLWGKILQDKHIQLNGRSGQSQDGVDIYGVDAHSKEKYGIQCKQKTYYKNLTIEEINSEIEKAKYFIPKLDKYILATTAQKDANIEKYVRELNNISHNGISFSVYVFGWDDILSELYNHNDILKKHYNFFINPHTPEAHYFNFWYREALIDKFFYYTCYLPFGFYDVKYSYYFLNSLKGYLNKHDDFLNKTIAQNSQNPLKSHISNFNSCTRNLLSALGKYTPKEDNIVKENDMVLTYWVDCKDLPYHEQGNHIETQKNNVRTMFYNLVQIANDIISIWNIQYGDGTQVSLIEFAQPNPNFGLIGDLYLIEPHYPSLKN